MSVTRTQFVRTVAVTAAATPNVTTVDILGPETTLSAPYAEGTDHVIDPRQVRQNEAGWVVIGGWDATALDAAALTVDVEIWSRGARAAQRNQQTALFPSGATVPSDPYLKRIVATGLAGNSDALFSALGGAAPLGATLSSVDAPKLKVGAGEFVRLRIANSAGALGPVTLTAKFDLGNNPQGSSLLA
jgi:hypothetical protein